MMFSWGSGEKEEKLTLYNFLFLPPLPFLRHYFKMKEMIWSVPSQE